MASACNGEPSPASKAAPVSQLSALAKYLQSNQEEPARIESIEHREAEQQSVMNFALGNGHPSQERPARVRLYADVPPGDLTLLSVEESSHDCMLYIRTWIILENRNAVVTPIAAGVVHTSDVMVIGEPNAFWCRLSSVTFSIPKEQRTEPAHRRLCYSIDGVAIGMAYHESSSILIPAVPSAPCPECMTAPKK